MNLYIQEYFTEKLPKILGSLEDLYRENHSFWADIMRKSFNFERSLGKANFTVYRIIIFLAVPIIDKCYESMISSLDEVKPEEDSNRFTNRLFFIIVL